LKAFVQTTGSRPRSIAFKTETHKKGHEASLDAGTKFQYAPLLEVGLSGREPIYSIVVNRHTNATDMFATVEGEICK